MTETGTQVMTETDTPAITETDTPQDTETITATLTVTITLTPNPLSPTPTITCACVPTATQTPTLVPAVQTDQAIVYPCPASVAITVGIKDTMAGDKVVLTVYASSLRKVMRQEYTDMLSHKYAADVSKLSNGAYALMIEIYGGNKRLYREVKPVIVIK
jgi:hypothetical protein